ncbi:S-adenosyl-L-methionine-dependent methyltransferase [Hypoxylon sp. FL1284]|nr:S-adenosyl-L-methionine-dependent methyltransferase [Hypoxylon sp. FL1284]
MATSTVDDLQALCSKLSLQIQALKNVDEDNDLLVRRTATSTARKLLNELIHPEELAADQIITLSEWACIRMYMKWKFFDKIPSEGGISYRELANSIDADEEVISRIGQMLVSTGKLLQPTSGYVAHSRLSPSLPSYFDKYGPRLPLGNTKIPLTYAFGADGKSDHWEVLARHGKEHEEQFGFAMQAMINYAWPYTGVYDFSWVEEYASSNSERPLIVDVGAIPWIPPSRCAVEDRAAMIPSIREDHLKDPVMKDVQKVAADLHKEQPVKGALVYLIRRCTHDYDDEDCVNILKILADSLPDDEPRARVLINDQIMTDPPHRWVAAMDIVMLTWASRERSEKQFADLAQRAGLVLVKVHRAEGATMGVVECKKA